MQCAAPMVSFMSVHASGAVIIDYLINIHKPSDLTASKLVAPALVAAWYPEQSLADSMPVIEGAYIAVLDN